jgi:hypothetical protein
MDSLQIGLVFFVYGLAFFSMGLATALEAGRVTDRRLSRALRFLGIFGLLHGLHEWVEMFEIVGLLPDVQSTSIAFLSGRVIMLALSFPPLAAFGLAMSSKEDSRRHWDILIPLGMVLVWGIGLLIIGRQLDLEQALSVGDVWARYTLAIPASLLAAMGLVLQCKQFQRDELSYFGQSCIWAAIAFAIYGVVGQ